MLPGRSRVTCMIYAKFPGLDLYCTDPAQHLQNNGRLGSRWSRWSVSWSIWSRRPTCVRLSFSLLFVFSTASLDVPRSYPLTPLVVSVLSAHRHRPRHPQQPPYPAPGWGNFRARQREWKSGECSCTTLHNLHCKRQRKAPIKGCFCFNRFRAWHIFTNMSYC